MAVNFNPEHVLPEDLVTNQRSIARHLDDHYYQRSFSPAMFVLSGAAYQSQAGVGVGEPKWPTMEFVDGSRSFGHISFQRPQMWLSGKMLITIYYTARAASTNNFALLVKMYAVAKNANLATGLVTLLDDATPINIAGPAAIDDEKVTSVYTTTSFDPSAERFALRVGRDGTGDANTGILQIIDVIIQHTPAAQEVHVA